MGRFLKQLEFSSTQRRKRRETAKQRRRRNLIRRLQEQLALANGTHIKDKRIPTWFWQHSDGDWYIELRYRNAVIVLSRHRTTVRIGAKDHIGSVIETLIKAVDNGELDKALERAADRTARSTKT